MYKRQVAALADIDAGVDMGAPPADQDVAGQDELTVTPLHTQTLGLGIAAVAGGADALLVGEELKTDVQLYEADIGLFPYMALLSIFSYV